MKHKLDIELVESCGCRRKHFCCIAQDLCLLVLLLLLLLQHMMSNKEETKRVRYDMIQFPIFNLIRKNHLLVVVFFYFNIVITTINEENCLKKGH